MARYFYAWAPLVLVSTIAFLALPWLGVIALIVVLLAAVAALTAVARAVVAGLHALVRSVPHPSWERVTHTQRKEIGHG